MSNGAQLRRAGFWDEENRRLLILCFAAVSIRWRFALVRAT